MKSRDLVFPTQPRKLKSFQRRLYRLKTNLKADCKMVVWTNKKLSTALCITAFSIPSITSLIRNLIHFMRESGPHSMTLETDRILRVFFYFLFNFCSMVSVPVHVFWSVVSLPPTASDIKKTYERYKRNINRKEVIRSWCWPDRIK